MPPIESVVAKHSDSGDEGRRTWPSGLRPVQPGASGGAWLVVIRGASMGRRVELSAAAVTIGRSAEADLVVDDLAVSRRHARIEPVEHGFVVTDAGSTNGLLVNGLPARQHILQDGDRLQLGTTVLQFSVQDALEADFQRQLYDAATRDDLTGAFNRRVFLDALEAELERSRRSAAELSVLVADVDHFKAVNDEHGHEAGDAALREIVRRLQSRLRPEDLLGRFGGEEFAVLLRYTGPVLAASIADRLVAAVRATPITRGRERLEITVSIGGAALQSPGCDTSEALLRAADAALYEAKARGRDQAAFAPQPTAGRPPPVRPGEATLAPREAAGGGLSRARIGQARTRPVRSEDVRQALESTRSEGTRETASKDSRPKKSSKGRKKPRRS